MAEGHGHPLVYHKGHKVTFVVLVVNVISHIILVFSIIIVVMDNFFYNINNDGEWFL